MKMVRKVLSVILIISLLFVVLQTSVLATDLDLNKLFDGEIPEIEDTNDGNTAGGNNIVAPANTNNTTNNTSSNETLPKTGITEDYAIIAFAVICGVSAIYAYKKIKNYNIK